MSLPLTRLPLTPKWIFSFVNSRYTKGIPFCQKWYIKGQGGGASPDKFFLSTPPPLHSPTGRRTQLRGHIYFTPILGGGGGGGGLIEKKGLFERGGLFNLEKTMVSVLHTELEYKVEKLKYKEVGGYAAKDQNQIKTSSW